MSELRNFLPTGPPQWRPQSTTVNPLETLFRSEKTAPTPEYYWSLSNFGYLRRKLSASSDEIKATVSMSPQIMHGNPVFSGTRIPVYQIVEELADGTTLSDIVDDYPALQPEQIQYALDFAASLLRIYDDQIPD